jgi:hypothetical protein
MHQQKRVLNWELSAPVAKIIGIPPITTSCNQGCTIVSMLTLHERFPIWFGNCTEFPIVKIVTIVQIAITLKMVKIIASIRNLYLSRLDNVFDAPNDASIHSVTSTRVMLYKYFLSSCTQRSPSIIYLSIFAIYRLVYQVEYL